MTDNPWDRPTRWLHLGLSLTVTVQLFVSLVMEPPGHHGTRTALESGAFEVHEWFGLAALVIVVLHWGWSFSGGRSLLRNLFPWNRGGWARVRADLGGLMRLDPPEGGPDGGLSGLVHGLGLLAVTFMAISGDVLFALMPESAPVPSSVHEIGDIHSFVATFVWIYWWGHIVLAVFHHFKGHDTLRNIYRL